MAEFCALYQAYILTCINIPSSYKDNKMQEVQKSQPYFSPNQKEGKAEKIHKLQQGFEMSARGSHCQIKEELCATSTDSLCCFARAERACFWMQNSKQFTFLRG